MASLRRQALRLLAAADMAVSVWADGIRQGAEKRVGSHDSETVVTDDIYGQALALYRLVHNPAEAFADHAEQIERGGR